MQPSRSLWAEHFSNTSGRTLFSLKSPAYLEQLQYRMLIECPFHQNHGVLIYTVSVLPGSDHFEYCSFDVTHTLYSHLNHPFIN